jgi:hypothetical protein
MEYLVTLIETTEHIVSVEADDECLARAGAVMGWHDGDLLDDRPRLLDLEAVSIIEVPMEDVA